jgi:hypothetical protein
MKKPTIVLILSFPSDTGVVRPLELLALHRKKIEAWILEQAGVSFDAKASPAQLHAVAA